MTENSQLVVTPSNQLSYELSVDEALARFNKIEELSQRLLKEGAKEGTGDYGVMPGTKNKVLFKAGAEKLCTVFRLGATYTVETLHRDPGSDHVTYTVRCTLIHQASGSTVGSALGLCSSKESKYRYRTAGRTCPRCHVEAIIKGKAEYGGGWLCFKARGGCGGKYKDGDPVIEGQEVGKIENPDIADVENTVLKMAEKRAHVAATLNALGISSLFTQDMIYEIQADPARSAESTGDDIPDSAHLNPPLPSQRGKTSPWKPSESQAADLFKSPPFTSASVAEALKNLAKRGPAAMDGYRREYWEDIKQSLPAAEMEATETLYQSLYHRPAGKGHQ